MIYESNKLCTRIYQKAPVIDARKNESGGCYMLNYDDIIRDSNFHEWKKYAPLDVQYLKYAESDPSLVAVGHKIEDVYQAFCNARASFVSADSKDFGDIAGDDEISKLYMKCHFLLNALLEYAICLDISWQVVWAYIQPSSLQYLRQQKYKKMEKECTRDNIVAQLKCAISLHGVGFSKAQKLLEEVTIFDNAQNTLKLRSLYNKIKHQGTIYFEGLGANFTNLSMGINGRVPSMLHRDSYKADDIENILFEYHEKFQIYMNKLIQIMVPEDYLESKMNLVDAINSIIHLAYIDDK